MVVKLNVGDQGAEENICTKGGSGWRLEKTEYDVLHNLYASPNIITVIKSRRMKWAGNVAGIQLV
jgi:hypothetical protein